MEAFSHKTRQQNKTKTTSSLFKKPRTAGTTVQLRYANLRPGVLWRPDESGCWNWSRGPPLVFVFDTLVILSQFERKVIGILSIRIDTSLHFFMQPVKVQSIHLTIFNSCILVIYCYICLFNNIVPQKDFNSKCIQYIIKNYMLWQTSRRIA